MHVRSIGLATELALAATRGQVLDRDGYLVVVTRDDPTYYLGNLLVLPAPPQVGEVAYWTRRFALELGGDRAIRHVALRWDGIAGDAGADDELRAAGFAIEVMQVMTATSIASRPPPAGIELRVLEVRELPATAELEYAIGDQHDESFRKFLLRRAAWKQTLVGAGRATWWGAFEGEALVGSLGLVPLEGRARYQDVQTAASHRRRGIASALLAAAAGSTTTPQLVIVAEPASAAERVYARAGFRTIERIASAIRRPSVTPSAGSHVGR